MLNEEKIRLMTKLALYEKKEGKKAIPSSKYYRGDYIGLHMIKDALVATLAFVLMLALWAFYKADFFVQNITSLDMIAYGRNILVVYLFFLGIYLVIAYYQYHKRFSKYRESLKVYYSELKQLQKIIAKDEKAKEELGGFGKDDEFISF